jgi:hypothetical protein
MAQEDGAKEEVEVGDEIRPASPINLVGRIEGGPSVLNGARHGERVVLEKG